MKDSFAGRTLPCKQCGQSMNVPVSEFGDDEWGDDSYEEELAPALPKRRKKKSKSGRKTSSTTPSAGKKILGILGMAVGTLIMVGAAVALFNGNGRAARGISTGVIILIVSAGWYKGTTGE